MVSKKDIAVTLSRMEDFDRPSMREEQYITDSEIASDILWFAFLSDEIKEKVIADLGAGTGILGIGCALLGARRVYLVEKDADASKILKRNIRKIDEEFNIDIGNICTVINKDIKEFDKKVDTIIQNPPFGTKTEHADKLFLEKAFSLSDRIYSFHKTSTESFVKAIAKDHNYNIKTTFDFDFPLKKSHIMHKKKVKYIKASCYKLVSEK